jgi:hypothetical protein
MVATATQNQQAIAAQQAQARQTRGNAQAEQAAQKNQESARVGILDADFVLIFPLAVILDVLSYILLGFDGGVIAAVVNLILGWIIMLWMIWRGKKLGEAKQEMQERMGSIRERKGYRFGTRKRAAQRAATRGVDKRVSNRILKRAIIMFVGTSIPIVNLIPFWTIGMIMMLREK